MTPHPTPAEQDRARFARYLRPHELANLERWVWRYQLERDGFSTPEARRLVALKVALGMGRTA